MRLQFDLKKVKLSPACHIQINRQAEEFVGHYAAGELYGAFYDDQAHITNIMPFPEAENMSTKQQLQAMQQRHRELLNKFNLDPSNFGWYMICYKQNFWDSLEAVMYSEKYINTSFFLVYDYQARLEGTNPYKAFRLSNHFALKDSFTFAELSKEAIPDPFIEIKVEVEKDDLFELLMMYNKRKMIQQFAKKNQERKHRDALKEGVEDYIQTIDEHSKSQKAIADKKLKENEQVEFSEYCHHLGINLKMKKQEDSLKNYHTNFTLITEKLGKA